MKTELVTRGLSAGSLFRLVLVGLGFSLGPLIVFFGVLSFFGAETVVWNEQPVTGAEGLLASIVMAPVFVGVFSALNWLFLVLGNWIYTRFRSITLYYQPD